MRGQFFERLHFLLVGGNYGEIKSVKIRMRRKLELRTLAQIQHWKS